MAPTWRRSSTSENDLARNAARQAAIQRRNVYVSIRAHLASIYPGYTNLIVRSQQTAGPNGHVNYVALVLYESAQSTRLTSATPVINYDAAQYYDDRLLSAADLTRYTVLLNGTPGNSQTEGLERLLERIEVLVRSGWRSGGS